MKLTSMTRDSIYRLARAGQFPAPRKLSERSSAWLETEVREWIESRPRAQLKPTDREEASQ